MVLCWTGSPVSLENAVKELCSLYGWIVVGLAGRKTRSVESGHTWLSRMASELDRRKLMASVYVQWMEGGQLQATQCRAYCRADRCQCESAMSTGQGPSQKGSNVGS